MNTLQLPILPDWKTTIIRFEPAPPEQDNGLKIIIDLCEVL